MQRLASICSSARLQMNAARPFPHLIVDPFLEPEALARVADAFPDGSDVSAWPAAEIFAEDGRPLSHNKKFTSDMGSFGEPIRALIEELHGTQFIRVLESVSGIAGLVPDPDLHGGGLHAYLPGALLGVHVDANVHPVTTLHRRLNLILYVNSPWDDAWGGELELWSAQTGSCERRISPAGNRCVIFATIPDSRHAMSLVHCPAGVVRKSIFVRYYSDSRPEAEMQAPSRARWFP